MNEHFKVGDKVRVRSKTAYCGAFTGSIGTVVRLSLTNNHHWPYDIDFSNGEDPWPFNEDELELVDYSWKAAIEPTPPKKPYWRKKERY